MLFHLNIIIINIINIIFFYNSSFPYLTEYLKKKIYIDIINYLISLMSKFSAPKYVEK